MPLAIFCEASVTMNGGIVVFAIRMPLNIPKTAPESRPMSMPITSGIPPQTTAPAPRQPDMAMMEPTERSMPPSRMHIVMPHASITLGADWRSTLKIFFMVGNVVRVRGQMHRKAIIISRAINMPRFSLK